MTESFRHLRGKSLSFTLYLEDDNGPLDWATQNPRAQLRTRPDDADAIDFHISWTDDDLIPGEARFRLTSEETKVTGHYVWDVDFTDPDAPEGEGEDTWPGDDEDRNKITFVADVTKVVTS